MEHLCIDILCMLETFDERLKVQRNMKGNLSSFHIWSHFKTSSSFFVGGKDDNYEGKAAY